MQKRKYTHLKATEGIEKVTEKAFGTSATELTNRILAYRISPSAHSFSIHKREPTLGLCNANVTLFMHCPPLQISFFIISTHFHIVNDKRTVIDSLICRAILSLWRPMGGEGDFHWCK